MTAIAIRRSTNPVAIRQLTAKFGLSAGPLRCIVLLWVLPFMPWLAAAESRPNIVIVMVDDMGFSDIGCYGSEISTPNLDALAAGGRKFSRFYNTGRCCPTRASLLTGLTSHNAGVGWMTADQGVDGYRGQLNDRCVTIAEVLRDAGYFTAMTGKWHVGWEHGVTPSGRGFDRSLNLPAGGLHFSNQTGSKGGTKLFLDGEQIARDDPQFDPPWYGTDLWTRWGLKFVGEAVEAEKPFFWYLGHVAPHFPCMAPEETIAPFRGRYMRGWDRLREERHARQIESGLVEKRWPLPSRPDAIPAWQSLDDETKRRYDDMMAIYAAMIVEVDRSIGKLVDALEAIDQLDNTLILFLSDNGGNAETGVKGKYEGDSPGDPHSNVFIGQCWAHLNNTPFRKYKHYNHEGGIATPLIAHWPRGIPKSDSSIASADRWERTPTHVIDLMATCVDLAGATYPNAVDGRPIRPMQGQSLRPLLTGKGDFSTRTLHWEHEGNAAILDGDWKLVRAGSRQPWELFDMRSDRTEQNNLASQQSEKAEQLRQQWREWAKSNQVLPKPPPKAKKPRKAKQA